MKALAVLLGVTGAEAVSPPAQMAAAAVVVGGEGAQSAAAREQDIEELAAAARAGILCRARHIGRHWGGPEWADGRPDAADRGPLAPAMGLSPCATALLPRHV